MYTCDVLLVRVCVSIIRHSLSESYYKRTLRCLNVPHALYTNNAFFTNLRFTHVVFRHCIQGNYIVIETSYFFLIRYRSCIVVMENGNGFWTTKEKKNAIWWNGWDDHFQIKTPTILDQPFFRINEYSFILSNIAIKTIRAHI